MDTALFDVILFNNYSTGVSTNASISSITQTLRRRRLLPDLTRIKHNVFFPPYRSRPLAPDEHLDSIGVRNNSTIYIRVCIPGGMQPTEQGERIRLWLLIVSHLSAGTYQAHQQGSILTPRPALSHPNILNVSDLQILIKPSVSMSLYQL